MPQRICTIGFNTHANDITNLALDTDEALYDFDVIIVRPTFGTLSSGATPLGHGGRILLAPKSGNLVSRLVHWREQLEQALAGGKTVFVLCEKPEDLGVSHASQKFRTISEPQPEQILNSY
jgi:hypothetical protein